MSKKLRVADFATILEVLTKGACKNFEGSWYQQGIIVVLNGATVTLYAVCDGQTIEITLAQAVGHPGFGSFFLSYSDLDTLTPLLRSDHQLAVSFSRSMQPLTKKPALLIESEDLWFQSYTGIVRREGFPTRSVWTRGKQAATSECREAIELLKPLVRENVVGVNYNVKLGPVNAFQSTIQVMEPMACIASAKCILY